MNKPVEELIQRLKEPDYKYYGCELSKGEAELVISALEKQMPKKPIDNYNWEDLSEEERLETPRWYCKSCDGIIEEHYSYCVLCGQAIDWRNK